MTRSIAGILSSRDPWGLLAAQEINDSFHMDTNIGNCSCGFNINWVKLLLAFGKSWNYQLCPLECNTLMYGEASISHHHVPRNQLAQDTTVFCQKLVRGSPTPCLRNKWNATLQCDSNQDYDGNNLSFFKDAACTTIKTFRDLEALLEPDAIEDWITQVGGLGVSSDLQESFVQVSPRMYKYHLTLRM